jgi:hypothetical protein
MKSQAELTAIFYNFQHFVGPIREEPGWPFSVFGETE